MLLPRRPPPAPEQAAAVARVRGLLPGLASAGWVPPPADEEQGWSLPPEPAALASPAPAPGASADAAPAPTVSPAGPVPVPAPAVGRGPAPAAPAASPAPAAPAAAAAAAAAADPDRATGPPAAAAYVPTLRERLSEGRFDPGRRAVVGLALVGVLACLVAGVLVLRGAPHEVAPPVVESAGRAITDATLGAAAVPSGPPAGEVVVAVAGDVRRPGLVRLTTGSRVDDAVKAAGGLKPGAEVGLLNLARRLVDGEQVVVGGPAPAGAPAAAGSAGGAGSGLVDLNTATAAELDALPGIGPVLAERIVDYRTAHGPFRSVDQLREVSGIGEAKYQSLHDAVTV